MSPAANGSSPPGGNSTRPSARLTAMTITPVLRPMSASRSDNPSSGPRLLTGTSSISIARLDRRVTSSANSTDEGLVRREMIRWAPMTAGITTWSAPAWRSVFWALGCSARAMISTFGASRLAVRVRKTFSASVGRTVTSVLARSRPASRRVSSSVAFPWK